MTNKAAKILKLAAMVSVNAAAIAFTCLLAGVCICKDGDFLYTISGTLLDEEGSGPFGQEYIMSPSIAESKPPGHLTSCIFFCIEPSMERIRQ
jgi:hypothetical protein